jgi:hypothetical protein
MQPPSRLQLHVRSARSSFALPLQYALAKPLNEDSQNFQNIYSFIAAIFTELQLHSIIFFAASPL